MLSVSSSTVLTGLALVFAVAACGAPPVAVEAPVIEATLGSEAPAEAPPEVTAATFVLTFGGAELSEMRMVMQPGETEREVRVVDGDTELTGVAEAIDDHRWLVGVAGVTSDACIVIRMTAEQEGAALRGWAVVDTEGRAKALPFVAEPTS